MQEEESKGYCWGEGGRVVERSSQVSDYRAMTTSDAAPIFGGDSS